MLTEDAIDVKATTIGVTDAVADGKPVPAPLVAVTEQVYVVLLVNPDKVMGDVVDTPEIAPGLQLAV